MVKNESFVARSQRSLERVEWNSREFRGKAIVWAKEAQDVFPGENTARITCFVD